MAGKPGPVQGVLALLDPLLRRATAIVKADYPFGWIARRLVANAGLILPATLALRLGLPELVQQRLDLGNAPLYCFFPPY